MKGRIEKSGLVAINRSLTGILAAAIVMSQLSGTGLVVRAAEIEPVGEHELKAECEVVVREEIISEEVSTEQGQTEGDSSLEPEAEIQTEGLTNEDTVVEISTEMETEPEETVAEESTLEEVLTKEIIGEEALFASVYLQFHANGGKCDISMIELTPTYSYKIIFKFYIIYR